MLWTRRSLLASCVALFSSPAFTQDDYVCPMDPDVHSAVPGKCPRCGMRLEARILEPQAYRLGLTSQPPNFPAGGPVELTFAINNPGTGAPVNNFDPVHEKLFHLFAVSENLEWFLHGHPALGSDGVFRLPVTFPAPGLYEIFADFYPTGAAPQWIPRFLYTQGAEAGSPPLDAHVKYVTPQRDRGVEVTLETEPAEPLAGRATTLFFHASPGDGLELWLGTYAHAFWVSHDLTDAAHTHPSRSGDLQFEVYFPRPGVYRFWLQFQRKGDLHTTKFDIAVKG